MDTIFSIDIISLENKLLNIIKESDKLNYSEEQHITKDNSVIVAITIPQLCNVVERNILCKQWAKVTIEQSYVKIDGYALNR